jgi:glutamyl-Q tRNA(Asp) synthetase
MQQTVGRFAPTPSGGLHLGSACAAIASFLNARSQGGLWKIRIDDIDKPREVSGSAKSILQVLEALGLEWDGPVIYQSQQLDHYASAIDFLIQRQLLYPCICTRKKIGGRPYPGTCASVEGLSFNNNQLRIRIEESLISFSDVLLGEIKGDLKTESGDFIVKRADGVFSYDISTIIDDEFMGVTEVIRGADLARLTLRHVYLQDILSLKNKTYGHISLVCDPTGKKLSKQTDANEITITSAQKAMSEALFHLGLRPTLDMSREPPKVLLNWALSEWKILDGKEPKFSF